MDSILVFFLFAPFTVAPSECCVRRVSWFKIPFVSIALQVEFYFLEVTPELYVIFIRGIWWIKEIQFLKR